MRLDALKDLIIAQDYTTYIAYRGGGNLLGVTNSPNRLGVSRSPNRNGSANSNRSAN